MPPMNISEQTPETQALIANDIHVLAGQLNDTIKRGAENGLKIEISCTSVIDIKGVATYYPVLSVKVLSELR